MVDYADPHFECLEFDQPCIDADCPAIEDTTGNADIDAGAIYNDAT